MTLSKCQRTRQNVFESILKAKNSENPNSSLEEKVKA